MDNYYKILGVDQAASHEEIKNAYRVLAKQLHPDRHLRNKRWKKYYSEMFIKVSEAYSVLSDPNFKKRYDVRLNGQKSEHVSDNFSVSSQKPSGAASMNNPERLRDRIRFIFENWAYEPDEGTKKQKHNSAYAEISKRIKVVKRRFQPVVNKVLNLMYEKSE